MYKKRILDHLKSLLLIRKNLIFYTHGSSGIYKNKVKFFTFGKELIFDINDLDKHIKRTKLNLLKSKHNKIINKLPEWF